MNIVFLEPLGISEENLKTIVGEKLRKEDKVTYCKDRNEKEEELIKRSKNADIVVFSNIKYGKNIISQCPNLKMICVAFTGVDHIDMDYCKERGITVCNCAGYSTSSVADIVFAMVITLARNIRENEIRVRNGETGNGLLGFELEGKTFGVIGTGAIGTRVCNIANSFGCNVIAYSRTVKEIPGVTFVSFEEVLKNADILSVHVPSNENTKKMLGKNEFAMMKKSAIFINTARGPIVDEVALKEALDLGEIAGAGLDVYDIEPPLPKNHILLDAPNTILTPHIAFASRQAFIKRADIVAQNIELFISGKPQNVK